MCSSLPQKSIEFNTVNAIIFTRVLGAVYIYLITWMIIDCTFAIASTYIMHTTPCLILFIAYIF